MPITLVLQGKMIRFFCTPHSATPLRGAINNSDNLLAKGIRHGPTLRWTWHQTSKD